MDVTEAFERAFGFGVMIENDVNLAVLGESWLGRGQGIDNLAYIALGTGVGSGLMVGGHLVRGASNAAGEMGFLPIGADPFAPESLRSGAFERVVATNAMVERYAALHRHAASTCRLFSRTRWPATGMRVSVLDETARYLAQGIAAIAAIANPEKVILGGSIGLRPEILSRVKDAAAALLPLSDPRRGERARLPRSAHRRCGDRSRPAAQYAVRRRRTRRRVFRCRPPMSGALREAAL